MMFYCVATLLKDGTMVWWRSTPGKRGWTTDNGSAMAFDRLAQASAEAVVASVYGDTVYVYGIQDRETSTLVDGYRKGERLPRFARKYA